MIKLKDTSNQYTTGVALNNHKDNSELLFNSLFAYFNAEKKRKEQEWVKRQNTAFFRVNLEQLNLANKL